MLTVVNNVFSVYCEQLGPDMETRFCVAYLKALSTKSELLVDSLVFCFTSRTGAIYFSLTTVCVQTVLYVFLKANEKCRPLCRASKEFQTEKAIETF